MTLARESKKAAEEKKEDKQSLSKTPLTEGIMKTTTATVLALGMAAMIVSCGRTSWGPDGMPDGGDQDAIVDARDGDVDRPDVEQDAGDQDEDAGVDAGPDEDMDAGVDAGDYEEDAGIDAGPDEDQDAGVDAGPDEDQPACAGVHNETVPAGAFDKEVDVAVGGYDIRYVAPTGAGATMDIRCSSDGSDRAIGLELTLGAEEVVELPDDHKRIRITVTSRNAWDAICNVVVEGL